MRKLASLVLILGCGFPAVAMSNSVEVGLKGGVNFTNISITPRLFDTRPDGQLAGGGFVAFRAHERVTLGAEFLFTELAVTADEVGLDARLDARAFVFPIPVRIDLGPTDRAGIFLSGGVQWTILGRTTETVNGVETVEEGTRDWDVGLFAGGGVHVPFRRGALSFEARYVAGLLDLDPDDDVVKVRTLFLLFGYQF